jgi:ferrous iron transport protein A
MVICPFCGFEFDRADTLCRHGCPLSSACQLTRCPSCDFEFPLTKQRVPWWRSLLGARRGSAPPLERAVTVRDLKSGERARVLALSGESGARRNLLAVFGLIPGAEVELLQRQPAFVLRVGETDLALDEAIAAEIVVGPSEGVGGGSTEKTG